MAFLSATCMLIHPDEEAEAFSILAGVLQGDKLAQSLFMIILCYATQEAILGKELGTAPECEDRGGVIKHPTRCNVNI